MNEKEKDALVDPTGLHSADPKHASVALPAGSFDVDSLSKSLNETTRAAAARRDDARDDAVSKAQVTETLSGQKLGEFDPAALPGYKTVDVKNDDIGVTEQVRVYVGEGKGESAADTVASGGE